MSRVQHRPDDIPSLSCFLSECHITGTTQKLLQTAMNVLRVTVTAPADSLMCPVWIRKARQQLLTNEPKL